MEVISIVSGDYNPTNITGGVPPCMTTAINHHKLQYVALQSTIAMVLWLPSTDYPPVANWNSTSNATGTKLVSKSPI